MWIGQCSSPAKTGSAILRSPKRSGEFKRTLDYLFAFWRNQESKGLSLSRGGQSAQATGGSCPLVSASLRAVPGSASKSGCSLSRAPLGGL